MERTFQELNGYFALAAALINAAFVVLVLARTSRTSFYMLFLYTCVSAIIWNAGIFMQYYSGRKVWFYFALIGSPMMPALMFHLINILVGTAARNNWITLAYTLSGLLSLSSLLAVYAPGVKVFVDSTYWNAYFLIALYPFIIGGIILLLRALRDTRSKEEKERYGYIVLAVVIGTCTGLTDLIRIFQIPAPKLGHAGNVLYSSIIAVGIFKHRRTFDILAQMQMKLELVSEMAAGIAHEIRNPLSSIKGASNLLASALYPKGTPGVREYIDVIREEIIRLDNILINLQDLTKPVTIKKDSVSINEIIRKTVKLAEVSALPISIRMDLCSDLPVVYADASLLKQVFLNLVKNATEACIKDGELVIKTACEPHWVKITFRDNGSGIPPELLEQIFDPFFTTKTSGMGLGLAITQRIVQAHNGRIEARRAVPRGSEFSIMLPE